MTQSRSPTTIAIAALMTALSVSVLGCGDDDAAPRDGGDGVDAGTGGGDGCTADTDCDDGQFCTGEERCDPGAAGANAFGCVAGSNPCVEGGECDEAMATCIVDCTMADRDGDGHDAIACGGFDCDDTDANRYPGNEEVCDSAGHDEDCDTTTFGFRDADGDGSPDAACCNTDAEGNSTCGDDCDDMRPGTNPDNPEVCNLRDDDCDDLVDEEVQITLTRDADGDMFGSAAAGAETMLGCGPSAGWVVDTTDCDDAVPSVHPGAAEVCNEVDDDCNMVTDDVAGGCECTLGMSRACGMDVGACTSGTQSCAPGGIWGDCSGVDPGSEACNMIDDDCDGSTDEGLLIPCYPDLDNDGYAVMGATSTLTCPSNDAMRAVAPYNRCPLRSTATAPTATRYDCDDTVDPVVFPTACYPDGDGDTYGRNGSSVSRYVCGSCPSGMANRRGDCCDTDSNSRPGALCGGRNACGSYDRNCSGSATTCIGNPTGLCVPGGGSGTLCVCSGGSCRGFLGTIPGCGGTGTYQQGCRNVEGFCTGDIDPTPPTQTCR